jgi:hypothetical protein
VSSDRIETQPVLRSSCGTHAAEPSASESESSERERQLAGALCVQLDRVLDELWAFANDQTAIAARVALAQLAQRLCDLYPHSRPNTKHRDAASAHALELLGLGSEHVLNAMFGRAYIQMTRIEAALFHYLVGNRDRILSREELMKEVWQRRMTGTAARTVDIHVHRLRRKLGGQLAEHVETVRNVGYRFSTRHGFSILPQPRAGALEVRAQD